MFVGDFLLLKNGGETMLKQKASYKILQKNADTLTPIGIYKRLRGEKKFLLESSFQHETKGKYSYIGANPYEEIIGIGNETKVINVKTKAEKIFDCHALDYLKEHFPALDIDIPLPFTGGAIGYVGYDAIREFVEVGTKLDDPLDMPDYHLMIYNTIIIYEHRTEKAHIVTLNVDQVEETELDKRLHQISEEITEHINIGDPERKPVTFSPQITKDDFIQRVEKAKTYIEREEAEQIVLSQRMVAELDGDPFSFYRQLRTANPSPYMYYIDFTDYLIIGASPESLVQTTGRQVVTNPIAGTRPRGTSPEEDATLEIELLTDEKELSEHEMLVELSKTDLQQVCVPESIEVPVLKEIVKYEHVMHIVSEVHGTLKKNQSNFDALIACLPAGTVSGSPKERAMQIINELETEKRGVYAGGIGYISFNQDINLAIAIRSLVVKDGHAFLQAGAGIVADSIPEKEYEETLHKAKSLTNLNENNEMIHSGI